MPWKPQRETTGVKVGEVLVGGGALPIVQSMTNTNTADAAATATQVIALAEAGSELVRITGPFSADKFWQLTQQRTAYVNRFLESLGNGRFDALICPPYALPALKHGAFSDLATAGSYAMLMNLLGFPAGVVAAGRVRKGEETDRRATRDPTDRAAISVEKGSSGMPVGVQVAARWWREDVVLAVMGTLQNHFRSQPDYPSQPPI